MNEWGIPDWRDASSYGDTSAWDLNRWRWEFYRRREDLRADFDRLLKQAQEEWRCEFIQRKCFSEAEAERCRTGYDELGAEANADAEGFHEFLGISAYRRVDRALSPDEAGFTINADDPFKYGYLDIPNPRIGEQPPHSIQPLPTFRGNPTFREGHGTPWERGGEPNASMSIGEGFIGVQFILDQPLGPQLALAETALKRWQSRRAGARKQSRPTRRPFLRYLRILDAIADDAEDQVADTILAEEAHCPDDAHPVEQAKGLKANFQF